MLRFRLKRLLFPAAALACLVLAGSTLGEVEESVSDRDLYDRFMEDLFARPEEDPSFLRSHGLVVTVRVGGEFDPDTQVSVFREGEEVLAAVVRAPDRPVDEQILRLRSKRGEIGYDEVRQEITVKRREVSSRKCPRLENLFADFQKLEISSRVDPTIYFPAVIYEIWVSDSSEAAYFELTRPSPKSDSAAYWGPRERVNEQLVEWIQELLSLVGGRRLGKDCDR